MHDRFAVPVVALVVSVIDEGVIEEHERPIGTVSVRVTVPVKPCELATVIVQPPNCPVLAAAEIPKYEKDTIVVAVAYPDEVAVIVATPPALELIVAVHEPPLPVVQEDAESAPRLVDREMRRPCTLSCVWMLIVEELTPSAGTINGVADIVRPHKTVVDACAALAQS